VPARSPSPSNPTVSLRTVRSDHRAVARMSARIRDSRFVGSELATGLRHNSRHSSEITLSKNCDFLRNLAPRAGFGTAGAERSEAPRFPARQPGERIENRRLAPRAGFEPATLRLTGATERNADVRWSAAKYLMLWHLAKRRRTASHAVNDENTGHFDRVTSQSAPQFC